MYATTNDLARNKGMGAFNWKALLSLLSLNLDLPTLGPIAPGFYIGLSGENTATESPKARIDDWIIVAITLSVPFIATTFMAYHLPEQIRQRARLVKKKGK